VRGGGTRKPYGRRLNLTAIPAKVRENVLAFLRKNMKRIVAC
jgi:hypothetical protein